MEQSPSLSPTSSVKPDRVHRDAYISERVFQAEVRQLFPATWTFVAHESQIPHPGDYVTVEIAGRPLLVLRADDGQITVFYNRCPHKGTKLYTKPLGHAGKFLKCPYHAWTFRLNGSNLGIPLKQDYAGTPLVGSEAGQGLSRVGGVAVYRDFIFVRLNERGLSFEEYFGPTLQWLDDMADRSPTGKLIASGGIIRNVIRCNWKMYLENINDTVHPVSTHESAGKAAEAVWAQQSQGGPVPMEAEQLLPFASGYDYFASMDAEVYPNGHSALGVSFSSHSLYAQPDGYEAALIEARGEQRSREILGKAPQNVILYPSIAVKGSPLAMRVVRPLAVDRTLIEAWSFRAEGAPDLLLEQALTYNRLAFSPMSIIAHDDIHLFERIQEGLRSDGNEWVSLHRGYVADEDGAVGARSCKGTSELLMRNQYRAWVRFMSEDQGVA